MLKRWNFLKTGFYERIKVQELREVCQLDYLLVEFSHMGIPLSKTLTNLETFAAKVMPRFAGDS